MRSTGGVLIPASLGVAVTAGERTAGEGDRASHALRPMMTTTPNIHATCIAISRFEVKHAMYASGMPGVTTQNRGSQAAASRAAA